MIYGNYYYDIEQDKFIKCSWEVYEKVDPKFMLHNLDKVKHNEFILAYECALALEDVCSAHVISTVCLPVHQDSISHSIYVTVIFDCDNYYNLYQKKYTSLEEAKEGHDKILLKIIRREDL